MFKVTNYKVRHNKKVYGPTEKEDIIKDLSKKKEKELAAKGYGEIVETVSKKESSKSDGPGKEKEIEIIPDDFTVEEVEGLISETDDLDELYDMLDFERETKNRKGVVSPLEEKIGEMEEPPEEGEVNVDLDPDQVITD
ncbi:MAG: hypothetical protein AWL62_1286 [Halanaerobium sp. T82-1]|jgi:hypothetical protein|nr:MAG: hypothetical protein AWL62_1286 [Halanaerobium sp. T82-1]